MTRVQDHDVGGRRVDENARVERQHAHGVTQQTERREHFGGGARGVREQEQRGHADDLPVERGRPGDAARGLSYQQE